TQVAGEVVEVHPPARIVFTYGYVSGDPIPPGSSRVTIQLAAERGATRLTLTHELESAAVRDQHVQGWRYQLSVFSNVVADHLNSGAAAAVDAWFDSWAEPDAGVRERTLGKIASPDIRFHDRYSNIASLAELFPHIAAAQHFMPGMRMQRRGDVRHCQGTVLADFAVTGPDGNERAQGTNVFVFGPSGRIETATGFMNPPKSA
ncbi:MAG: SRPBCC domain-containing protein, partial [Gemmatimonadales bacterium]